MEYSKYSINRRLRSQKQLSVLQLYEDININSFVDFSSDILNQYLIRYFCRLHSDKICCKVLMSLRGCEIPVRQSSKIALQKC